MSPVKSVSFAIVSFALGLVAGSAGSKARVAPAAPGPLPLIAHSRTTERAPADTLAVPAARSIDSPASRPDNPGTKVVRGTLKSSLEELFPDKNPRPERVAEILGLDAGKRKAFSIAYEEMATKLRNLEISRAEIVARGPQETILEVPEFADEAAPLLEVWILALHHLLSPREAALYWSSGAHRALFVRGFGEHRGRYWVSSFDGELQGGTSADQNPLGGFGENGIGFEFEKVPDWLAAYIR